MRREAKAWLEQADEDLKTSEVLLESGRYYASAFFAHQAVEKAMKGHLMAAGKYPDKTHSLVELAEIMKQELALDLEPVIGKIRELNPHYTISRYPDAANGMPAAVYDRGVAEKLLNNAREILSWLRQNLRRGASGKP